MSDHLRDRFDSIDLAYINQLIKDREPESLHLEYKRFGNDSSMKKNYASIVSGLANADGGIVIWGIGTRRPGGEDVAFESRPSDNATDICRRFNQWKDEATNPPVEGVMNKIVEAENGNAFICTYVPASDGGPHMAMLGVNQYKQRRAGRTSAMEHFEVADMFGKRPRPTLALEYRLRVAGIIDHKYKMSIIIFVKNTGRGAARDIYAVIRPSHNAILFSEGIHGSDGGYGLKHVPQAPDKGGHIFCGGSSISVPQDSTLDITAYDVYMGGSLQSARPSPVGNTDLSDINFDVSLHAEGASPCRQTLEIPINELLEAIQIYVRRIG